MYERKYQKRVLKDEPAPRVRVFPWRRILVLFGSAFVIFGAITLIRLPRLQVQSVTVQGTNVADPNEVSQYILDELNGYRLWILPKTSIFLINLHSLQASVQSTFPRFSKVAIDREGVSKLSVVVSEYHGVYLWCEEGQDLSTPCRFMDSSGVVFASAPYFSGDAYPKIYGGVTGAVPFTPLTTSRLALVPRIADRLTALSIKPLEYHFISDHELDVVFVHGESRAKIIFDPSASLDDAFIALFTGLRTDPLSVLYRTPTKVLQYIDLRFTHKIVYKFQQ